MGEERTCRIGRLSVSVRLLLEVLSLPPDTNIKNVAMSFSYPDTLELIVEHSGLPEIANGAAVPPISVVVRCELSDAGRSTTFEKWVW